VRIRLVMAFLEEARRSLVAPAATRGQ
jgi:hypothetical protein